MQSILLESSGTQRYILLQSKEDQNRRRKRRESKKRKKATLPTKERVFHILATGKLKDYTHPSETDPYWDRLYRQYELLCYTEMLFKTALRKLQRPLTDTEIVDVIVTLEQIKRTKELLTRYMTNAMQPMYGSVMSKKFYGWYEHLDEFIATFNETAVQTLQSLRFDPNRTRCSVYFYQVFWLTGISLKNEIGEDTYRYSYVDTQDDRSDLWSSEGNETSCDDTTAKQENDDFTTHIETELLNEHDDLITLGYTAIADDFEVKTRTDDTTISNKFDKLVLDVEVDESTSSSELTVKDVVNHILNQVGLCTETLPSKGITELGAYIKKLMKSGRIKLSEKYVHFLKEKGYNIP